MLKQGGGGGVPGRTRLLLGGTSGSNDEIVYVDVGEGGIFQHLLHHLLKLAVAIPDAHQYHLPLPETDGMNIGAASAWRVRRKK